MIKRSILALFLLLIVAGAAYTLLRSTAHEFTQAQCPDCHAGTPVKSKRETLRMVASIQYLCGRCHGERDSLSHPVEIYPASVTVPADLPLSWEGKMTCSTCHDIHAGHQGFDGAARSLRRQVTGAAFCSACHANGAGARVADQGHAESLGKAHMKFDSEATAGSVDRISRACLACHDGSLGTADNVQIRSGSWSHGKALSRFDPQGSHPIGVRYVRAMMKRGGLRPVGLLNRAIKLIDGKVGCASCHDPYSREHNKLVMSNNGSKLCLECHDK